MDASPSVPQPEQLPTDEPLLLDPSLRDLLNLVSSLTHALSESGAFDDLSERQAERVDAAMALIARDDPSARRVAYLQLLDLLLAEPERFRTVLTTLHDQLAAVTLPPPIPAPQPLPHIDTMIVSPSIAQHLRQLTAPPVTRWIDGQLYISASGEQFERVHHTDYDRAHERAWLTTADGTHWLVPIPELAASRAA